MKKYLLFFASFFVFTSLLFAELTQAQLWAISLSGILTENNGSYRNSLNTSAMDESGSNTWLTVLRRDWDITTREELLDMLGSLEQGGHAASFREIQDIIFEIIKAQNESERIIILTRYEWTQAKANRYNYVFRNWEKYDNITLKAWDLGRCISLCRWGYNVGFITEDEAWEKIFHFASLSQSYYDSWEEFGNDYFLGRLFWASSSGQEERYAVRTEPIYRRLLNSYWNWLDWDVDLKQDETPPLSVNTIRFLQTDVNGRTRQFWTNDPALYNKYSSQYFQNPGPDPDVYECRVKKVSGDDNYAYGIFFCADDANRSFYRLFITVLGTYTVQKHNGKTWLAAPLRWSWSPYLDTGYDVYNTLRVERIDSEDGAEFRISFNGKFAASFVDNSPLDGQKIGLVASVNIQEREQFPHIPVDVRFDW